MPWNTSRSKINALYPFYNYFYIRFSVGFLLLCEGGLGEDEGGVFRVL